MVLKFLPLFALISGNKLVYPRAMPLISSRNNVETESTQLSSSHCGSLLDYANTALKCSRAHKTQKQKMKLISTVVTAWQNFSLWPRRLVDWILIKSSSRSLAWKLFRVGARTEKHKAAAATLFPGAAAAHREWNGPATAAAICPPPSHSAATHGIFIGKIIHTHSPFYFMYEKKPLFYQPTPPRPRVTRLFIYSRLFTCDTLAGGMKINLFASAQPALLQHPRRLSVVVMCTLLRSLCTAELIF